MSGDGEASPPAPRDASWRLLSEHPPIYACDDFLTPEESDAIRRAVQSAAPHSLSQGGRAKLRVDVDAEDPHLPPEGSAVLRSVDRRVAASSGVQRHGGEMPWAVHFTPAAPMEDTGSEAAPKPPAGRGPRAPAGRAAAVRAVSPPAPRVRMNLGLHVDTNNCRERRWLTFIVYLHTTPPRAGGHTVFPLALRRGGGVRRTAKTKLLRNAAEVLLGGSVHHTGQSSNPLLGEEVHEAGKALLAHAEEVATAAASVDEAVCWHPSGVGMAASPMQGSCVAFFTRSEASGGGIDPRSWHGGADVFVREATEDVGKWTLQMFREAPPEVAKGCCVETFARSHSSLRPSCGGGVRFDVEVAEVRGE